MMLSDSLRLGMRRLASGVCVVTSYTETERFAMTASSVTSLSDSPASLLICINQTAAIAPILNKGQPLAVSILNADQQDISNKCAEKLAGDERFAVGEWAQHEATGLPYLETAQVTFFCEVDNDDYPYGTHRIVVGKLTDAIIADEDIEPLVYLNGSYQKLA